MKKRIEDSVNKFNSGYNCAQAVACAFCDIAGISPETAFEAAKPYGGGKHKICGAVAGMYIIANAINGNKVNENSKHRLNISDPFIKKLSEEFIKKRGSVICADLPKKENGIRKCEAYVRDASEILADNINS